MKDFGLKNPLYISLFLFLAHIHVIAQPANTDTLDRFITTTLAQFQEIPGLSITVVKGNQAIFTKSYGYGNLEKEEKASITTSYYIASATKPFVGLLAAQLAEENFLDLDQSIANYAPIKHFKDKSLFEGVSIRDLLSHTSGIYNAYLNFRFASQGEYTRNELIQILEKKTKSWHNNKSYRYDNFGYNVFDLILSEELGKNWKNLLQEKFFVPFQMNRTSAYLSKAKNENWKLAIGYTSINETRLPTPAFTQKNDATLQAAGGLICSITDAQKWLILNMNQGKLDGKQYISPKVISLTHQLLASERRKTTNYEQTGYGLGWNIGTFDTHKVRYHSGGFDGFFSHFSFLPEQELGIAIFVNESHFGDNVGNLITSFTYDLLLGKVKSIADYQEKTHKVAKRIQAIQVAFDKDRKKRSTRHWTLDHQMNSYQGKYHNPYAGTLQIDIKDGLPIATLGISKSIGSPSTSDNAIRVEFRDGNGRDIIFINHKKKPCAAIYNGDIYYRR